MPAIPILFFFLNTAFVRPTIDRIGDGRISDSPESKLREVKVAFLLATDCPISRQYVPAIRDFVSAWHAKGLRHASLVFCNGPGRGHRKVVRRFLKEYEINLPWRTDPGNRYARRMGAGVVPQVMVFRSRHLMYSGAIDDMFAGLGLRRSVISEHYLEAAIEAILNGRVPEPASRPAYGCLIE